MAVIAVLLALAVIAAAVPIVITALATARPQTVVSLTFDDGDATQLTAVPELNRLDMHGTFYVVSGYIGANGYFSRNDLTTLEADGHEIGGHTVSHPDLTTIAPDEVAREICNDRSTLTGWGHSVRSFAYPFASSTPAIEDAAKECGYSSARMLGDIRSPFGCEECDVAETMPPVNPWFTRAVEQVESSWTLEQLQSTVTNAEKTGGWVQLTFHSICDDGCGDPSMSSAVFTDFVNWLAPRAAAQNTVVKTVGEVLGGVPEPVVPGPVAAGPGPGENGIVNPGLETMGDNGFPSCFAPGGYGANTPTYSFGTSPRTGGGGATVSVAGHVSGDAKILQVFDGGSCAPTVAVGHTYSLRAWYSSTAVTQFAVYLRSDAGVWEYWTSSPWFGATETFEQAEWTTPEVPRGFSGISYGLNIFADGQITTDDYELYDSVGAPPLDDADASASPERPVLTGSITTPGTAPNEVAP